MARWEPSEEVRREIEDADREFAIACCVMFICFVLGFALGAVFI